MTGTLSSIQAICTMTSIGYSEIAPSYHELHKEEQLEKLRLVLPYLKLKKNALILDIGCATGLSSFLLSCNKVGLDSSMEMLRHAPDDMDKVCGLAETLPFKHHCFDAVICLTAIHNFADFRSAIAEMKRVSKGSVVVSVLKRSKRYEAIMNALTKGLLIDKELESDKDTILICKIAIPKQ